MRSILRIPFHVSFFGGGEKRGRRWGEDAKLQPAANIAKKVTAEKSAERSCGCIKTNDVGKNSAVLERESDGRR